MGAGKQHGYSFNAVYFGPALELSRRDRALQLISLSMPVYLLEFAKLTPTYGAAVA
jgi:hypothetical protein